MGRGGYINCKLTCQSSNNDNKFIAHHSVSEGCNIINRLKPLTSKEGWQIKENMPFCNKNVGMLPNIFQQRFFCFINFRGGGRPGPPGQTPGNITLPLTTSHQQVQLACRVITSAVLAYLCSHYLRIISAPDLCTNLYITINHYHLNEVQTIQ